MKWNNIFFFVGLASVVVMILTLDVSFTELWQHICKAGWWLVPIFGLWGVLYCMNCLTWRTIISGSGKVNISFLRLLKVTVSGFSLNYATPGGLMGGEAYRIMELTPYIGKERAASSVILFFMMHVFSHFWFWLTSIVVYVLLILCGTSIYVSEGALYYILPLATIFCLAGIYLFTRGYKNGIAIKLVKMVSHIPGLKKWGRRLLENNMESLERIDRQIAQLHSQSPRIFYVSFFLEYFGRLAQCFEIFFMLRLLDIDCGGGFTGYLMVYIYSYLILSFTSLFANILGFLPLQLGGREGGFAISVVQLGMSASTGVFISVVVRAREIVWTLFGLLLMKVKK